MGCQHAAGPPSASSREAAAAGATASPPPGWGCKTSSVCPAYTSPGTYSRASACQYASRASSWLMRRSQATCSWSAGRNDAT